MSQILSLYQADAFTNKLFGGNPAAVVPLQTWPDDEVLQKIALENNLSETAFTVPEDGGYHLRWFTPAVEVDLCGHATLAAAHVLFTHLGHATEEISFRTRSGKLTVKKSGEGYEMDFPADPPVDYSDDGKVGEIMGSTPAEIRDASYLLTVYDTQEQVEQLKPDFRRMKELKWLGVIATAPASEKNIDFISRFFCPNAGIDEDPVTGSAHTILTPYWATRTGNNSLNAKQISQRGGYLECVLRGDRVVLRGQAVTYLKGKIYL